MFKRLWDWIFDIGNVRSEQVFSRSVSGKPLVKLKSGLSGWSVWNTQEGLQGAHIAITITQLGNNIETIKALLRREYDDYLSEETYDSLVLNIQQRLEDGGYYFTTKRNNAGNLDFVRVYWENRDKQEITTLLENYLKRG